MKKKTERNQAIIREYRTPPMPTLAVLAAKYDISIPRVHEIIHRRRPKVKKPGPKPRVRVQSGRRVVASKGQEHAQ